MNTSSFQFAGHQFEAAATRALFWPDQRVIVVSDLHLGKSERVARRSGQMLPPYETQDTLSRLDDVIRYFNPKHVICLGDSFDDIHAGQNLDQSAVERVNLLMAGRDWIWIEGNHDPGPLDFGGRHLAMIQIGGVTFRHIAAQNNAQPEVSGHYHPKAKIKAKGRTFSRPCFLFDQQKVILPSFGTYTGGLFSSDPAFKGLMGGNARAILTGDAPHQIPMPR
jgi:DNA ligase-associated metallophosphoesterase